MWYFSWNPCNNETLFQVLPRDEFCTHYRALARLVRLFPFILGSWASARVMHIKQTMHSRQYLSIRQTRLWLFCKFTILKFRALFTDTTAYHGFGFRCWPLAWKLCLIKVYIGRQIVKSGILQTASSKRSRFCNSAFGKLYNFSYIVIFRDEL